MNLYKIDPTDHATQTAIGFTLAELKAVHNALAVDLATDAGTTLGGLDKAALLARIARTIEATPPTGQA